MSIADGQKLHIEVKVSGTLAALGMATTPTVNILHYRRTNTPADLQLSSVVTAFQALVEASWLAAVSASWTWDATTARCINDATGGAHTEAITAPGDVTGECLPGFNNMLITKQTASRGRSYRGRVFINGVPESGVDGNTLTAGQLTLLGTLAGKLDDGFTDADGNQFTPFLFSPTLSQIEANPTEVLGVDITGCTAKDPVAVLRSRKARL